jgi:pimeloyl-ACP methyl ester carboxylesterase
VAAHTSLAGDAHADLELSVAHARLRYRDEGAGPAVLLIHGWTLDLEMWEPQARALCDSFRIIRFDRRGFGLSSGQPALAHDIADVHALCEHLNLSTVALVGMSQGARVAAHLAAEAPALVSCVVFDGPPSGILQGEGVAEEEIPLAAYRELIRSRGIEAFRKEWCRHPLVQLRGTHAPTQQLLLRMLNRYRALDLRDEAPHQAPPVAGIEAIHTPALVISGQLDLQTRIRAADELARALTGSERAIVPGAGHLPNLDNPAFYNRLLRQFLQRLAT